MSLREAFGQARLLTLLLLAGMGWIVFTAVQVVGNINYWGPSNVGQTASVGIIGLVMLAAGASHISEVISFTADNA
jgi:hypothetical protein